MSNENVILKLCEVPRIVRFRNLPPGLTERAEVAYFTKLSVVAHITTIALVAIGASALFSWIPRETYQAVFSAELTYYLYLHPGKLAFAALLLWWFATTKISEIANSRLVDELHETYELENEGSPLSQYHYLAFLVLGGRKVLIYLLKHNNEEAV